MGGVAWMGSAAKPERKRQVLQTPESGVHVWDGCAHVCVSACGGGRGGHPWGGGSALEPSTARVPEGPSGCATSATLQDVTCGVAELWADVQVRSWGLARCGREAV